MKGISADLQNPLNSIEELYGHLSMMSDINYLREHKIEHYISEKVRVVGEIRRLAENTDDVKALIYYAGLILEKAPYIPHDVNEAESCLLRAVEADYKPAYYMLMSLYMGNYDYEYVEDNHADDIAKLVAKLKEQDDAYAQYYLARYYLDKKSVDEGLTYLDKALDTNLPEAIYFMAKASMTGDIPGVERDGKVAYQMFKRAYERILTLGEEKIVDGLLKHKILFCLGCMYRSGWGVTQNGYTGHCLIAKAAEKYPEATKFLEGIVGDNDSWFFGIKRDVAAMDIDSLFEGTSAALDFRKIIYDARERNNQIDEDVDGDDTSETEHSEETSEEVVDIFDPMDIFSDDTKKIIVHTYDESELEESKSDNEFAKRFANVERRRPKILLEPLNKEQLDKIFEPLDNMIGLGHIKQEVRSIVNFVQLNRTREAKGLPKIPVSMHMVFSGPPGTGKTTIARLVGDILWEIGYLDSGHVVEVSREDLIGEYIGWTSSITSSALKAAKGGIFFLDEAYTLSNSDSSRDFGYEAIDVLNKQMEDNRDDMVVIVAGYKDEMRGFLDANPGLKSRFKHELDFEPMDGDQLYAVYQEFCRQYEFKMTESTDELLKKILKRAHNQGEFHRSNARGVRDMFERMLVKQAARLAENMQDLDEEALMTIEKQDLHVPETFNDGNITYLTNKKKDD